MRGSLILNSPLVEHGMCPCVCPKADRAWTIMIKDKLLENAFSFMWYFMNEQFFSLWRMRYLLNVIFFQNFRFLECFKECSIKQPNYDEGFKHVNNANLCDYHVWAGFHQQGAWPLRAYGKCWASEIHFLLPSWRSTNIKVQARSASAKFNSRSLRTQSAASEEQSLVSA